MRCFGGVFLYCLCGLGGWGEAGVSWLGRVAPFKLGADRVAMRFCAWRMPTPRSPERPGLLVESS